MLKQIYLTIDDVPSIHLRKKVDFLSAHNIPAIFFARGEFIEQRPEHLIYAIQKGFLIGNHSYSHPFFSQISLDEFCSEILRTEKLIDDCYTKAGVVRPAKIIRLPFGDRGAGIDAAVAKNDIEREKVTKLQNFLRNQGFVSVKFAKPNDGFVDVFWDWDTDDYKIKMAKRPDLYKNKLQTFWDSYTKDIAILLLHDFEHNQRLFNITMRFLLDQRMEFSPIDY